MNESLVPSDYEEVRYYIPDLERTYADLTMKCCRYEYYCYLSFYFKGVADDGTILVAEYMVDAADVDGTEVDLTSCSLNTLRNRLGNLVYEVARKKECPPSEEN